MNARSSSSRLYLPMFVSSSGSEVIMQITDEVHVDEAVGEAPAPVVARERVVVATGDDGLQRNGRRLLEYGEVRACRRGAAGGVDLDDDVRGDVLRARRPVVVELHEPRQDLGDGRRTFVATAAV